MPALFGAYGLLVASFFFAPNLRNKKNAPAAARSIQIQPGIPPFSSSCCAVASALLAAGLSSAIALAATAPIAAPATPAATILPTPEPDFC